jgi:sulfate transport system substrate-binding protein
MTTNNRYARLAAALIGLALGTGSPATPAEEITLLNVSYDPTREFYEDYNKAFNTYWKAKTGDNVTINQSHGGGGKQTRAIIDGLDADVATLAVAYDVNQLAAKAELIPSSWQSRLPNNSSPYTSTIVFLVRGGNPFGIKDWNDLAKKGVSVVTPNPKTSGGARWNYLGAWGYGLKKLGSEAAAQELVKNIFANVAVLDTGARGSTVTFAEREIGDVLITWENEAHLVQKEYGKDKFDIVYPSISILAEPPVTVVDVVARKHGTTEVAQGYLEYLYSKEGQELAAKHFYRPSDKAVLAANAARFPAIELFTIKDVFGSWDKAQNTHFADGAIFDKIYGAAR